MYVYVIAASLNGPSKIGMATHPEKRLRALQTGSPFPLTIHHIEAIGRAASTVERAVHHALASKRAGGGTEWFEVTPEEARLAVRASALAANVLIDDSISLHEISKRSALQWIHEIEKYRAEHDDEDGYVDELEQAPPPDIFQIIADPLRPPTISGLSFNDYLLTWDDGMWLRWAFQKMGEPQPSGKRLAPYQKAASHINAKENPALRWIEWSAARELQQDEIEILASIWDRFIHQHNLIERDGPQWAAAGIDDHVDDVYLSTLKRDKNRGDRDCLVFWHKYFRAVLFPTKQVEFCSSVGLTLTLQPIGNVKALGFLAPTITSDVWMVPFHPWLSSAPTRRDERFGNFIHNPQKRFPSQRPYDGPNAAINVAITLSSIDENGFC
jgi:hypothetical protein